jgi:hypothetical protein
MAGGGRSPCLHLLNCFNSRFLLAYFLCMIPYFFVACNFCCTVLSTTTVHPFPGNQEFCLAPSETIVEQVKKYKTSYLGYSLRVRTLGIMHGRSLVHFT